MTCDHDYRENAATETVRFIAAIGSFGLSEAFVPRRCRKCGREEGA